jgi:hypothetical protein
MVLLTPTMQPVCAGIAEPTLNAHHAILVAPGAVHKIKTLMLCRCSTTSPDAPYLLTTP